MATSHSFEADLPELNPEQLARLYTWGQSSCNTFDLRMNADMTMTLSATRKKVDSARGHQRLLRTNLVNWGVSLPNKQNGWLRLISGEGDVSKDERMLTDNAHVSASSPTDCISQPPSDFKLTLPENLLRTPIVLH